MGGYPFIEEVDSQFVSLVFDNYEHNFFDDHIPLDMWSNWTKIY